MKPHPTNDNRGKSKQMHENDDMETKMVSCRIFFDLDELPYFSHLNELIYKV